MNVTIVTTGGATKMCEFVEFAVRGAWARIRWPGAAGLFSFSLVHGGMECKRSEYPVWCLSGADLDALRVLAKDKGIKCSRSKSKKGPLKKPNPNLKEPSQLGLFAK